MFLDTPTTDLRQGDVCFGLPYPNLNLNRYSVSRPTFGEGDATVSVPLLGNGGVEAFAVLSHDCDLDNLKSAQRGGIIIAPVLLFPISPDHESNPTLIASARPDPETNEYDFINLFPLELPMVTVDSVGSGWHVIDFSLMTAVGPSKAVKKIVGRLKKLELTDATRTDLANKLASFFGRSQDARE